MYKVDLHTHSVASPDGGLTIDNYRAALKGHTLDYIAITDHNRIDFAQAAHDELGPRIIIGEEIMTSEGEMIGLFLQSAVPAGHSLQETAALIHAQGGLVCIPHPFETVRSGVRRTALDRITTAVDIMETHNGRAVFQNRSRAVVEWARDHHIAGAASSDSHGYHGWGNTYSVIDRTPDVGTLPQVLQAARYQRGFVGPRGVLYPKYNRLKRLIRHA